MALDISPSGGATAGPRDARLALVRGWRQRCPACGRGAMFGRYLKVTAHCTACGTALHHHRADDAPPYFTMFIVGHVVIGGVLAVEKAYSPDPWLQMAAWAPLTVAFSLWLLPRVKGAIVGYQWALGMHGFGESQARSRLDAGPSRPASGS